MPEFRGRAAATAQFGEMERVIRIALAQVNIKAGQSVTGGSAGTSAYAIVVYTPGAYQVTGTVSDSQVNLAALGQSLHSVDAQTVRLYGEHQAASHRPAFEQHGARSTDALGTSDMSACQAKLMAQEINQ